MTGSNWPWLVVRWHIDWECLQYVASPCQGMGRRSSPSEIEPRWIHPALLTIDPVKNGNEARHCSSGHEMGTDSSAAFLLSDPFLHELSISLLLFEGMMLGFKRDFEDVTQLHLIGNVVLYV